MAQKCSLICGSLFLLFFLYGCSSEPADSDGVKARAAEKPKNEIYTIEIQNMKFVPDSIVVNRGDEVVFVNRDMVNHCVTEEKTKAWTSGPLPSGEAYPWVATESSSYFCAIHVVMKGKIIVRQ